jgi:starch-binding outer membrane protein, SusD/RagB family
MKNIFKLLLITGLCMLGTACEDAIEYTPENEITGEAYWKNQDDVKAYLSGTYNRFRLNLNTTLYGEDRSDYWASSITGRISTAWSQNLNEANAPEWTTFYNTIYHTNLLLQQIESINFTNPAEKNRIKAQAHFIRAYTYFLMAKTWGDVPLVLEPVEGTDAPLPARSSVQEVFNQINADIDQALALFPEAGFVTSQGQLGKNQASKVAAYALQADVKMWTAKVLGGGATDLQAAINAINQIATSGVSLLPEFSNVFASTSRKNAEIIFSLYMNFTEPPSPTTTNGSQMYARLTNPTAVQGIQSFDNASEIAYAISGPNADPGYQPSVQAKNLLNAYPNDKRKKGSYIDGLQNGVVTYAFGNKFRGTQFQGDRYFDDDIVIYRWADMLLLRAEANAALNNISDAVTDLNLVRVRAGIGVYAGPVDKATLEREIVDERGRELFHENKRWWDLVRAHHGGVIDIYTVVPNLVGKTTPLYWPVASRVRSLNPNIAQTVGYQ